MRGVPVSLQLWWRAVGEILRKLCEWQGVSVIEAECCPDHKNTSGYFLRNGLGLTKTTAKSHIQRTLRRSASTGTGGEAAREEAYDG